MEFASTCHSNKQLTAARADDLEMRCVQFCTNLSSTCDINSSVKMPKTETVYSSFCEPFRMIQLALDSFSLQSYDLLSLLVQSNNVVFRSGTPMVNTKDHGLAISSFLYCLQHLLILPLWIKLLRRQCRDFRIMTQKILEVI